jgi:CRP-like cAMP-binding protein
VAAIQFFSDLPERELDAIAEVAFEFEMPTGQALTTTGGLGHTLFAVETGTADVVIDGTTVASIESGDVVGEIAVLASPPDRFVPGELADGGSRTASVVATSPMRMIALYKRDVWALSRQARSPLTGCAQSSTSVVRRTRTLDSTSSRIWPRPI